ncbi:MAG TPA: anthranilate phosphoribosyltransferase [Polyangia bacterium]|nr:anthranilate phosphoribosyltransferase [Polyangia bacterium]
MNIKEALARAIDRKSLTADEMAAVVGEIMDGQATQAQIGGLLVALRMKGETVDEIVGAARAMRARMVGVDFAADPIIDTCGTGGDGSLSVNVSTIAAFLVAGAGVVVAKHGNRAQSSRSGSHDVIEALGLDPAPKPEVAARCLREAKLAFLFAPAHHAATKHVGGPRKEVGVRTIFNLLGPLTNPAGAKFHVNGIFSRERCELLAQAHGALGSKRAMVVHGAGGLDEFAPAGATFVAELGAGGVETRELAPADFGLDESDPAGLRGGLPADNARIALEVLEGRGPQAARNATLMTAGAAIYVAGAAGDLRAATVRAREVLDGGGGTAVLETLRRIAPASRPAS